MTAVQTQTPIAFAAPSITDEDVAAVSAVLRSGWLTTGHVTQSLESDLADILGVRHVLATSSCTAALECSVAALQLRPGARVAVPSWTFVSTVTVLLRLGLVPVLLDSDRHSLNLSGASLARALEGGVDAVVPVHFAGVPVAASSYDLMRSVGVPVVDDCAHALGARLPAGRGVRAGCYSFYATKNITCAEGGAVATDDDDVADFVRSYRLHGMSRDAWRRYEPGASPTYDLEMVGTKANLPDLLAALGRAQLRRLTEMQLQRRRLVRRYREELCELAGVEVVPPVLVEDGADHLMVILLPPGVERRRVISHMADDGVGVSVHFQPVHRFAVLDGAIDISGGLSVCEEMWPRVLSLPLHAGLPVEHISRVVSSLDSALRAART